MPELLCTPVIDARTGTTNGFAAGISPNGIRVAYPGGSTFFHVAS